MFLLPLNKYPKCYLLVPEQLSKAELGLLFSQKGNEKDVILISNSRHAAWELKPSEMASTIKKGVDPDAMNY